MSLFEVKKQSVPKALHEKYVVPPFSVFNTHQPYYRQRMRMWRDMGMCGTNGRITSNNGLSYDNRRMDKRSSRKTELNGTSIFSPVLTEVVYKWFTPHENSKIFDPFTGGITRGAIASVLGHNYVGFDINPKQVESNIEEFQKIVQRYNVPGKALWYCHNSADSYVDYTIGNKYDLIFTCPPYFSLEKYSDIEGDLSLHTNYKKFMFDYEYIIDKCYYYLEDDSFMVWVVSDVRNKDTGEYYGLVADTIKSAQHSGFKLYNEIILYNETGNLAITSGDYLKKARKVGRQHQNVLVFYKGDTGHIKRKFGELV